MKNWLLSRIFRFIGSKLSGYKTYGAGVGFILIGITGFLSQIWPDAGLPQVDTDRATEALMAGLACFGVGHKIEKATQPCTTPQGNGGIPEQIGATQEIPGPPVGSGGFGPNMG